MKISLVSILIVVFILHTENTYAQISDSLFKALPDSIKPKIQAKLTRTEKQRLLSNTGIVISTQHYSIELRQIADELIEEVNVMPAGKERIAALHTIADYFYVATDGRIAYSYYARIIKEAGFKKEVYKLLAYCYQQMGAIHSYNGNQDSAIQYLHKALDFSKEIKDSLGIASAMEQYSQIYYGLGLYQRAIYYIDQYLESVKKWGYEYTQNYILKALYNSKLYTETGKEQYADSTKQIVADVMLAKKDDSSAWYGSCFFFLGYLQFCKKDYSKALAYFDSSLLTQYRISDKYYNNPAPKYFFKALCLIKTGKYKTGKEMLDGVQLRTFSNLRWKSMILYEYAESVGDWKSAYYYHDEYARYTDSMNLASLNGFVFDAEQKYSLAEKQAEITGLRNKNLRKEKEQNRIAAITIYSGLFLVITIAILYGLYRRSSLLRINERQRLTGELYKMEGEITEEREEQQLVQQALITEQRESIARNIHDEIMSGVAALRYRIAYNKSKVRDDSIQDLLSSLEEDTQILYIQARNFLADMNKTIIRDERYSVINLLKHLGSRFHDEKLLLVTYDCDEPGINQLFTGSIHYELYLVIKEALANIIRHANADRVNINIRFENTNCILHIKDNGKGFDKNLSNTGLGITSISNRIKILKGSLQISSGVEGTSLKAEFPVS